MTAGNEKATKVQAAWSCRSTADENKNGGDEEEEVLTNQQQLIKQHKQL